MFKVHLKYTSEFEKNASIQKVYFKHTSNFEGKFVSLESLPQGYFWPRKEIQIAFQKQVQSILEVFFITKFLMDSKYTWNINFQCHKLWKSK